MQINNVTSFDNDKVWFEFSQNKKIVFKKTNTKEKEALITAKSFFEGKEINIGDKTYNFYIPEILNWDESKNIIQMQYFDGENLEILLTDPKTRKEAVIILNSLLKFIIENGFYWTDFAPRNILIKNNTICLLDFEKGLSLENLDLQLFLRNHVFEEYTSFLLKEERCLDEEEIFKLRDDEHDIFIKVDDIKVKRVKATLTELNYPNIITQEQFLEIYKLFLQAEEPYIEGDEIVFPRIKLEEILSTKNTNPLAYQEYAKEICNQVKFKTKRR